MRAVWTIIRARSWRSFRDWLPLLTVGLATSLGLALAFGARSAVLKVDDTVIARDGPGGLEPALTRSPPPLRASQRVQTVYGPLAVTLLVGDQGQELHLPGLTAIEAPGTVQVSPEVARLLHDDWSGELGVWIDGRDYSVLAPTSLAHPSELVMIEHFSEIPPGAEADFHSIRDGTGRPVDTSWVIVGLCVLVLPSVALSAAGVRMHLSRRSARYGLLRCLGMPPLQLRGVILVEIGLPLAAGALMGLAAFSAVTAVGGPFRAAGTSYWWSDMRLPASSIFSLVAIVVVIGIATSWRMAVTTSRDPLTPLRRQHRRRRSWAWAGVLTAPPLIFAAERAQLSVGVGAWLIVLALLLAVFGLAGSARLATRALGRVLHRRTSAQIAGSRMFRSPATTLIGAVGTSTAILLVAFILQSNFSGVRPGLGTYDAIVDLPNISDPSEISTTIGGFPGVERVVQLNRFVTSIDGREASVFSVSCSHLVKIATLSSDCADGSVFLASRSNTDKVAVANRHPAWPDTINGLYPVVGQIDALWLDDDEAAIAMSDSIPAPHTKLFVTTDGSQRALRSVLVDARSLPEVENVTSSVALEAGVGPDTLIFEPFLVLMAFAASVMAAIAVVYSALMLFRQRESEFAMVRCLGSARSGLARDLGTLFSLPLVISAGLALGVGSLLAASYNSAHSVPARSSAEMLSLAAVLLVAGLLTSLFVALRSLGITPLVSDPDATT